MNKLLIKGHTGTSEIISGESFKNICSYIDTDRTIIISDKTVHSLYSNMFPQCPVILTGTGESIKTLKTVESIIEQLIELGADRQTFLLAVGGGIVCDIAGFAASIYMRGIEFGFVPTTLLSQVDASIGGKNGVNFSGYKNIIGCFTQPSFVLIDTHFLNTLDTRELNNGFAEIIKHGLIKSSELYTFLKNNRTKALKLDPGTLNTIIDYSLNIKADVVIKDEKEAGLRKILNFGHTIGHAIEKSSSELKHGEAVGAGMIAAAKLSYAKGMLTEKQLSEIIPFVKSFGFKETVDVSPDRLISAVSKDKKSINKDIHFILLKNIGEAVITPLTVEELRDVVNDMCQSD